MGRYESSVVLDSFGNFDIVHRIKCLRSMVVHSFCNCHQWSTMFGCLYQLLLFSEGYMQVGPAPGGCDCKYPPKAFLKQ